MSTTIISHWTASSDLHTFQSIIERMYASSDRLVSTDSGLTDDICTVLSSAKSHENSVECVRSSLFRQFEAWGCGTRTTALWTCLFYRTICDLVESGMHRRTVNALIEIVMECCAEKLKEVHKPVEKLLFGELCSSLAHGVPDWDLLVDVCTSGNKRLESCQVSPDFLRENVMVQFEQSSQSSEVVPGFLIRSDELISGPRQVVLVAGDVKEDYCHIGYKGIVKEGSVTTAESFSRETTLPWKERLVMSLKKLGVQIILSTGICEHDFVNTGIIVVSGIQYDTLDVLARNHNVDLLPSVDFTQPSDVITLKFGNFSEHFVCLDSELPGKQNTILIRRPVKCDAMKRYKSFVSRVFNALEGKSVIPGAGKTESLCSNMVKSSSVSESDIKRYNLTSHSADVHIWYSIVAQKLSDIFCQVSALTDRNVNDNLFDPDSDSFDYLTSNLCLDEVSACGTVSISLDVNVFDEPSSKLGAWKTAFETAMILSSVSLTLLPKSSD